MYVWIFVTLYCEKSSLVDNVVNKTEVGNFGNPARATLICGISRRKWTQPLAVFRCLVELLTQAIRATSWFLSSLSCASCRSTRWGCSSYSLSTWDLSPLTPWSSTLALEKSTSLASTSTSTLWASLSSMLCSTTAQLQTGLSLIRYVVYVAMIFKRNL